MMKEIKFYTTQWCGDCVRSKALLNKLNVTFEEIDIDVNKEAYEFVRDLQNAKPRIPTILFDDGSYLIEPTDLELSEKINSYLNHEKSLLSKMLALSEYYFPIFENYNYGMELSSSIAINDSLPIMALIFKPLSFILPFDFQYFGLWILICFILQGQLGLILLRKVTNNEFLSLLREPRKEVKIIKAPPQGLILEKINYASVSYTHLTLPTKA